MFSLFITATTIFDLEEYFWKMKLHQVKKDFYLWLLTKEIFFTFEIYDVFLFLFTLHDKSKMALKPCVLTFYISIGASLMSTCSNSLLFSDGSGTKNPGTGRIRVVLFQVPGRPGTRILGTGEPDWADPGKIIRVPGGYQVV